MTAHNPFQARTQEICEEQTQRLYRKTDRLFAGLMLFQWLGCIAAALIISPSAWAGSTSTLHPHVYVAVLLGGLIMLPPAVLGLTRPGEKSTRHTIAVCQALTSALLIHLTGGRIETHFHVFGSLAFLAFYRNWAVLVTATAVVAADHFLRGVFWPQSVYGVLAVAPWRWLEHAGWVLFEDAFLIYSCIQGRREMRKIAEHQAHLEETNKRIEEQVRQRTQELRESQLALFHAAKLESVGRLAAGVAHEVKNPLAITLLGINYLETEVVSHDATLQPIVASMKDAIIRADSVIRGLLDFASPRAIDLHPQPLNAVLDQALLLVRGDLVHAHVEVHREYADDLPLVRLDTQKIQQVLVNLCVNSCQAMPEGGHLILRSWADGDAGGLGSPQGSSSGPSRWVHVQVDDTGTGVPEDKLEKLFEPFFTTKPPGQGTGLGLSVSKRIMELHSAEIRFRNRPEGGARATLTFPVAPAEHEACPSDESSLSMTR